MEAQANTREREPLEGQERKELAVQPGPPEPDAVTIARAIRLRFAFPKGGVEVVAPGRLDRREAARGDGIPFRLDLPGRSALLSADSRIKFHHRQGARVRAR